MSAVLKFTEVDLPKHCEITVGELEEPGTAVELPDGKHAENVCEQAERQGVPSKPLDLTKVEELSAGDAARFRSRGLSAGTSSSPSKSWREGCRQAPRVCDWLAAETLARCLRATPRLGRAVVLDPACKGTALLSLELYSDFDWAGCPETRRSTDNIVVCLGGAVVQTSCQTQPGLPATSSGGTYCLRMVLASALGEKLGER